MGRLPDELRRTFTEAQIAALNAALAEDTRHPVDIRMSLPLPHRRAYMVVLGGPEKRPSERLEAERGAHPLTTLGNIVFGAAASALFVLAALLLLLIGSSVLEF